MKKKLKNCVLCGSDTINKYTTEMPVFMGTIKATSNYKINSYTLCECDTCGEMMIAELLDLNDVYLNNHNTDIVGNIWSNHYNEFSNFILNDIKDKIILEIGDPSAKIANISKEFKKWYIVEPNIEKSDTNNIIFINSFFDDSFDTIKDVDIIIHSHYFEHSNNPNQFLKKCNEILKNDGTMFMSVPNMEYLLDTKKSISCILNFEHTFYLNDEIIDYLLNKNGFSIESKQNYENHSIFYKIKKTSKSIKNIKLNISSKFNTIWDETLINIQNTNNILKNINHTNIYIYGAHVNTQFYLYNGIDSDKIKGIIDNSKKKKNQILYGTDKIVNSPDIIENMDECVVICNHVGIYYDEISKQLKGINKNVKII
jgi:SAM-dependent methyltransferase